MQYKIAKDWVKELRSGKYGQVHSHMLKHGKYSVLGLLCKLHSEAHNGRYKFKYDIHNDRYGYISNNVWCPFNILAKWANLNKLEINNKKLYDLHLTFDEYADIIEKHYKEL